MVLSDLAVALREFGQRMPPELKAELSQLHNDHAGGFDCEARAEGEWCCLDRLTGADGGTERPV